jgi:hypothetical protein
MRCELIKLADGSGAIICGREPLSRSTCCVCGAVVHYQCDAPAPTKKSRTCDRFLCSEHRHSQSRGVDFCPELRASYAFLGCDASAMPVGEPWTRLLSDRTDGPRNRVPATRRASPPGARVCKGAMRGQGREGAGVRNARPPQFRPPWIPSPSRMRVLSRQEEQTWRPRPPAHARGYDHDWLELRRAHLEHEPYCRHCRARGVQRRAAMVDHIEPLRLSPERRLDPSNLQSLCLSCHAAKTHEERRRNN